VSDALAKLAPVARPLLEQGDTLLATHGAPPGHEIWRLLGALGVTPAALVATVAELEPDRLRAAAARVREQERAYGRLGLPRPRAWEGAAARQYAAVAQSLTAHVSGDDGLANRLAATASYVDTWAEWQQRLRDELARALAGVMSSADAVAVLVAPAQADPAALTAAVAAAARIGAALLRVAHELAQECRDIVAAPSEMTQLTFRRVDADRVGDEDAIRLS